MQFDKVSRLVENASARGEILLGGRPGDGLFFPPSIVAGLANGDALVDEKQFGPALPDIRYSDVDEVIAAANDSQNGLGGSVWSSDIDAAKAVGRRMECGSVSINKHGAMRRKPNGREPNSMTFRREVSPSTAPTWPSPDEIEVLVAGTVGRFGAGVPGMKASGWGRIIKIASAHGLVASPYKSACVTVKHGIVPMTTSIAPELAKAGVTCNAMCPGYVLTPLVESQISGAARARGMTEEQVKRDVILAAENITAITFPVDVGWTAA